MIYAKNYEKNLILGTLDAWLMGHSSQQPSEPAHYIEDCSILRDFCPNIYNVPVGFNVVSSKRAVH